MKDLRRSGCFFRESLRVVSSHRRSCLATPFEPVPVEVTIEGASRRRLKCLSPPCLSIGSQEPEEDEVAHPQEPQGGGDVEHREERKPQALRIGDPSLYPARGGPPHPAGGPGPAPRCQAEQQGRRTVPEEPCAEPLGGQQIQDGQGPERSGQHQHGADPQEDVENGEVRDAIQDRLPRWFRWAQTETGGPNAARELYRDGQEPIHVPGNQQETPERSVATQSSNGDRCEDQEETWQKTGRGRAQGTVAQGLARDVSSHPMDEGNEGREATPDRTGEELRTAKGPPGGRSEPEQGRNGRVDRDGRQGPPPAVLRRSKRASRHPEPQRLRDGVKARPSHHRGLSGGGRNPRPTCR